MSQQEKNTAPNLAEVEALFETYPHFGNFFNRKLVKRIKLREITYSDLLIDCGYQFHTRYTRSGAWRDAEITREIFLLDKDFMSVGKVGTVPSTYTTKRWVFFGPDVVHQYAKLCDEKVSDAIMRVGAQSVHYVATVLQDKENVAGTLLIGFFKEGSDFETLIRDGKAKAKEALAERIKQLQ